jgi:hypothetical protein
MTFEKELAQLVEQLKVNADLETSFGIRASSFKEAYLSMEFLSKYRDETEVSSDERSDAALLKWQAAEMTNAKTNFRLSFEGACDFGWTDSDIIDEKVRHIIADILGPVPYPIVFEGSRFSNGASTRVGRSVTAAIEKCKGKAHVSTTAMGHWGISTLGIRRLRNLPLDVQESSVYFTVPKNSTIDRSACKEPEVNMILQRALGKHIRTSLKRVGIDLRDQGVNQRLARDALKLGLATVDLSAASDSITEQLVVNWLPPEWFVLLNDLRVKSTILPDGSVHQLQMFSSMGNGFTFELESLLFYALTRAIAWLTGTKGKISVYGDDIIAPSKMIPRLIRVFAWYGFKVNPKKSNWRGLFRESCGKHYYDSMEVTPFYVREPVRRVTDVIRLLNRLLQWDACPHGKYFLTREAALFHQKWSKQVNAKLWGGTDPEDITSLVTGDSPRSRIVRVNMVKSIPNSKRYGKELSGDSYPEQFDADAALTHWFCSRAESDCERFTPPYAKYLHGTSVLSDELSSVHKDLDEGVSVIPKWQGRHVCQARPRWSVRTTWTPYYLYGAP